MFRDELAKWCHLGYDFIGTVIYNPHWQVLDSPLRQWLGLRFPEYFGNGGFALKKVATFPHIRARYQLLITSYLWVRKVRRHELPDGLFTAQCFPKLLPGFRMPPQRIAQEFGAAYEEWEEDKLPFTNRDVSSLPFGMHGRVKYHLDYWQPVLRQLGYQL